ncbi:hypothetical protein [Pollutibacter soli]|uniref:hypothetical protein n=1 Tax=Pollutibacter soli TaxID=3034157 RepID=UPI0030135084
MRLLLLILICIGNSAVAQPLSTVIKTQAIEMGKALVNNDMTAFKKFMYPKLVQMEGGEKKLSLLADSALLMFKSMGGTVNKIIFGNPADIITNEKQLQTTLSQTIYLATVFADIEYETTLLALSKDGGKNWYFIDTSLFRENDLRTKLPEISTNLVIPKSAKPKIIPKSKPAS